MEREALSNLLAGSGRTIVTDVICATCATWLRAFVVRRLDTRDPYLYAIATPKRSVAVVNFYNVTDEGWR